MIASQGYELEFRQKLIGKHFPEDLQVLFPSSANDELTLLSLDISGVLLNCHFFTQTQIEFDLDPAEVRSADQLVKLFEFMQAVAGTLGKDVLMTPENEEQYPIFGAARPVPKSSIKRSSTAPPHLWEVDRN